MIHNLLCEIRTDSKFASFKVICLVFLVSNLYVFISQYVGRSKDG